MSGAWERFNLKTLFRILQSGNLEICHWNFSKIIYTLVLLSFELHIRGTTWSFQCFHASEGLLGLANKPYNLGMLTVLLQLSDPLALSPFLATSIQWRHLVVYPVLWGMSINLLESGCSLLVEGKWAFVAVVRR